MSLTNTGYLSIRLIRLRVVIFTLFIASLMAVTANATSFHKASLSTTPRLLTQLNSNRAVALEAVNFRAEPFQLSQFPSFGDSRTRIILFATDVDPAVGDNRAAYSVDAEDGSHRVFSLTVEEVTLLSTTQNIYEVHVRLHDQMVENGDVLVRLNINGAPSRRVRVGLGRIGGGLPDDGGPEIASISPATVPAGSSNVTLLLTGSNFLAGSKLVFNGAERNATISNGSILTATLPPSDLSAAGTFDVCVRSTVGISNTVTVDVTNPQPLLSALSPTSVIRGSDKFTLNVSGNNFVPGSVVRFNGSNRLTTFVSATALAVQILASDLTTAGSFPISVVNNGPGGGTSAAVSFVVNEPTPPPPPGPSPTPAPGEAPVPYPIVVTSIPGLWGYWRMNETSGTRLADFRTTMNRPLSTTGQPRLNVPGLLKSDQDRAIAFNGSSQYASASSGLSATSGLSISMLVQFTDTLGTQGLFGTNISDNPRAPHFNLTLSGGSALTWRWADGGAERMATFTVPLIAGRKHHIVLSHSFGSQPVLILDGKIYSGSGATYSALPLLNDGVKFGQRPSCCSSNAKFDETAVWTRALTVAEAQQLFRAARGIGPTQNKFVISTTGSYEGAGTESDPLDLMTASNFGLATSDTQFLLSDGVYNKASLGLNVMSIPWQVSGTSGHPVVITNLPGASPKIDLIDTTCIPDSGSATTGCVNNGNIIKGSYVRFLNLEVLNSNRAMRDGRVSRTSNSDSTDPPDTERGAEVGFNITSGTSGVEIVNCRIHDVGTGIFKADNTQGGLIEGNLFYNIGWFGPDSSHGPAIYAHNRSYDLIIKRNIFFNGLRFIATQIRATQSATIIEKVRQIENLSYGMQLAVLNSTARDHTIDGNQVFGRDIQVGENDQVRKGSVTVTNNYVYPASNLGTPLQVNYWDNATITGNTLVGGIDSTWTAISIKLLTGPTQVASINNNQYYAGRQYPTPFQFYAGTSQSQYTFSAWRNLGYDTSSSFSDWNGAARTPQVNVTRVYPSSFQPGRANLVCWNWENGNCRFDLSTTRLTDGQAYEIRNAFDWDAGPYMIGTYSARSPQISITKRGSSSRALWIGQSQDTPTVDSRFQVFVLIPRN
jgi:hypothetical protein